MSQFSDLNQVYNDGLSLSDLQSLSPKQRQILNWVRQQGDCDLLQIALHFCQDEETTSTMLKPLIEKGLLTEFYGEEGSYYRVHLAARRSRTIPSKLNNILNKDK